MRLKLFDYKILNNSNENLLEKTYSLVEELKPSAKFSHQLNLFNNQYREVLITSDKPFEKVEKGQLISFIVKDVVTFSSKINSKRILYYKDKKATDELVKYWLYHTFSPILFTFENIYYILHAGAVEIENTPVLFVADSFGGKSTLTDFFINKGHTMISDDKVATFEKDDKIYSVPSYPYHRPYRKVEDLGIYVENFAKENKPINSIFNLVKSEANSKIKISKISGIEKFKVLRHATDIDLPINQKSKFERVTQIANKTDIYNITIPWDLDRLDEVYQAIINFIKTKEKN